MKISGSPGFSGSEKTVTGLMNRALAGNKIRFSWQDIRLARILAISPARSNSRNAWLKPMRTPLFRPSVFASHAIEWPVSFWAKKSEDLLVNLTSV